MTIESVVGTIKTKVGAAIGNEHMVESGENKQAHAQAAKASKMAQSENVNHTNTNKANVSSEPTHLPGQSAVKDERLVDNAAHMNKNKATDILHDNHDHKNQNLTGNAASMNQNRADDVLARNRNDEHHDMIDNAAHMDKNKASNILHENHDHKDHTLVGNAASMDQRRADNILDDNHYGKNNTTAHNSSHQHANTNTSEPIRVGMGAQAIGASAQGMGKPILADQNLNGGQLNNHGLDHHNIGAHHQVKPIDGPAPAVHSDGTPYGRTERAVAPQVRADGTTFGSTEPVHNNNTLGHNSKDFANVERNEHNPSVVPGAQPTPFHANNTTEGSVFPGGSAANPIKPVNVGEFNRHGVV